MSKPSAPDPAPLTPAATLILMRETSGAPEFLMLERAAVMAFAAGALVFPGGRVDPGDHALAAEFTHDAAEIDEIAARIAAIRETIEESGIAVALSPSPPAHVIQEMRTALAAGQSLGALLAVHGLHLEVETLSQFARWIPRPTERRRFDTRFYIVAAPDDAREIADGGESVHAFWGTADQILSGAREGKHRLIFPTLCNLHRLAQFANLADALADAAAYGHHIVTPVVKVRDGQEQLCIATDAGYPFTGMPANMALRG